MFFANGRPDRYVVPKYIEPQMTQQSVWSFCGAPGAAYQATDIGAIHCGGVIEGKQGIMTAFFEFALADDAGAAAFFADVVGPRHDLSDGLGITDVLICCDF